MTRETITLICPADNLRLDKFLAAALPNVSRSQVKRYIIDGLVVAEGLPLKPSTLLAAGTMVVVALPEPELQHPVPKDIPLDILFEDQELLVINKPAGLVVHPAAGHAQDTLVNALLHHLPSLAQMHPTRPGIVHRLDKDTSGVMVVAKTNLALHSLQRQFKTRQVQKLYVALVHGWPQAPEGIIDVPLGRNPKNRQHFAPLPNGKPARTKYTVTQVFEEYSLLNIELETGRTHQIRVHLAWLGHPVVGDTVYGHRKTRLPLARQFLHASQLSFTHPTAAERLTFKAPLPPELQVVLQSLRPL